MKLETEVCVVGAGPAGSTIAARMAQLGHQVILIEKSSFPRPHVGEAMTPTVWPLLDLIGARSAVEAVDRVSSTGARVRWVDGKQRFVPPPRGRPGFTIDRARFDQVLLEIARSAGAAIMQPAQVSSVERDGPGWRIELSGSSHSGYVCAKFLVDAGGRGSRLGGKRIRTSPRTIALDGLWSFDQVESLQTQLDTGPEGWYWGAVLPGNRYRAMAFIDPGLLRRHRIAKAELESFYVHLLSRTRVLTAINGARIEGSVIARDATCYFDPESIDNTSIKVGEAAYAIDPLSSSGVQKALQTALSGSMAVNTILEGGDQAAAVAFYLDNQRRSVVQHTEWAAERYRAHRQYREAAFWLHRARPPIRISGSHHGSKVQTYRGGPVRATAGLRIARSACAVGDHVEMRETICHPGLSRPVGFVNGIDLIPLLVRANVFNESGAAEAIPRVWTPLRHELAAVSWLVGQRVLEAISEPVT